MKSDEQIRHEFDELAIEMNKSKLSFAEMSRVWNFFLLKVEPLQREMLFEHSAKRIKEKIQRMMQDKMQERMDGKDGNSK